MKDIWFRYEKNLPDVVKGLNLDIRREEISNDESPVQEPQKKPEASVEQLALQAWKDAQIAKANAAYKADKISAEKYTAYINRVNACTSIPENNKKN